MPRRPAPRISIILATFNRKHLVGDAIASALAQSERDLELIVVDDGGHDGTESVVLPIARADRRVVYVHGENRGLAGARNRGIALAGGEWLAFLDDDDLYHEHHLKKRLAYLEKNPQVDGTWGGLLPVGPRHEQFLDDLENPGKRIHVGDCHISGTLFLRRTAVTTLRGFRPVPCEDYDLCSRFEKRFRLERVRYRTYLYRVEAAPTRLSHALGAAAE